MDWLDDSIAGTGCPVGSCVCVCVYVGVCMYV